MTQDGWDDRRVARVLGALPLCQANPGLCEALLQRGRLVRFEAGATLIDQGAEDRTVFFVLRGDVDVRVHGHLVAVRPAGQHVGEMAAINPKASRSATVTAREPVFAWSVDGDDIERIGVFIPGLWRSFAAELADRLAQRGRMVEKLLPAPRGPLLGPRTVDALGEAVRRRLPEAPELQRGLLAQIDPGFLAGLPLAASRAEQPASDLRHMAAAHPGGGVPLRIWLRNALELLSLDTLPVVRDALRELEMSLAAHGENTRLERIIHRNDMLPLAFAEGMVAVSAAVAHLTCWTVRDGDTESPSFGTGWLIAPQLLVTAFHVVRCREEYEDLTPDDLSRQVASLEVRFDYHTHTERGAACSVVDLVASCGELDYAIVRLDVASSLRPLRVRTKPLQISPAVPVPVNVIQHPSGGPKMFGIRNNLAAGSTDSRLRYFTDTERGSSGAPVFNDRWEVVAVHTGAEHAGPTVMFQGELTAYVNRGTRIDCILADLRDRFPAVADEIERSWGQAADEAKPA